HIFSHVEWQMHGYEITLAETASQIAEAKNEFVWASPAELADTYSIPSAFQYFLNFLEKEK
uniref:NUDIX domain-containing protein n=1 Tax=Mitsuokella sp. TaxID=2049034 RepID=UPI003D7CF08E